MSVDERAAEELLFDDYGGECRPFARRQAAALHSRRPRLVAQGLPRLAGRADLDVRPGIEGVHQAARRSTRLPLAAVAARRQGLLLRRRAKRLVQPPGARSGSRAATGSSRRWKTTASSSPAFPATARPIVFRHLFDLYRLNPQAHRAAAKDRDRRRRRRRQRTDPAPPPVAGHRRRVLGRRPGHRVHRRRRLVGHGHRAARAAADHQHARGRARPGVRPRRRVDLVRQRRRGPGRHLAGRARRRQEILVAQRKVHAHARRRTTPRSSETSSSVPTAAAWPTSAAAATCGRCSRDGTDARALPGLLGPAAIRLVARRQVDGLCRRRQRVQQRRLDRAARRLAAAVQPLAASRQRVSAGLVARRPARSPSPAGASPTRSISISSGSARRTKRSAPATGRWSGPWKR